MDTNTPIPSRLTFAGTMRPGNTIEARWIVGHPMETGFSINDSGQRILRNVITQVRVLLDDRLIMELEPGTGMSANPYFAFSLTVPPQGGSVRVEWLDDAGRRGSVQHALVLEK
jgi:sulfur-oxidizing protein SoxZ